MVSVDGQVFDFVPSMTDSLKEGYSPADILAIGQVLATLGSKIGTRFIKALLRKATTKVEGRVLLKGPTVELAKKAEAKRVLQLEAGRAYINKNSRATLEEQQVGRALNHEAQKGRLPGIKRVEGGVKPKQNVKGRKGDYDFFTTDGRSIKADLYQPSNPTGKLESITAKVFEKSGQAEIVVVQVGRGSTRKITESEARKIAQDIVGTPDQGIRRVIIRWEGQILADLSKVLGGDR